MSASIIPPATPASESPSATPSILSVEISGPSSAAPLRRNEHLAVMISRDLWKPDSEARRCDTFNCPRRFGLFERRHHCRRCGGVFCQPCSSHATSLLDVSKLDFHLPPRGKPISSYASHISPVATLRVCDACYDAIHGLPPRLLSPPTPVLSSSSTTVSSPRAIKPPSPSSSFCSSLATPPDGAPAPTLSRRDSSTSTSTSPQMRRGGGGSGVVAGIPPRSPRHSLLPSARPLTIAQVAPELAGVSCGELDAYPLRFSSAICKATGGGLWAPKPAAETVAAVESAFPLGRPGTDSFLVGKTELDELAEKRRRANPIIKHGEFQYRFPPQPTPPTPARYPVSTF